MGFLRLEFDTDKAAEEALTNAGFSIGHKQRSDPRGILFGPCDIAKWRHLTEDDKKHLHGLLLREGQPGTVSYVILHSSKLVPAKALHTIANAASNHPRILSLSEASQSGKQGLCAYWAQSMLGFVAGAPANLSKLGRALAKCRLAGPKQHTAILIDLHKTKHS